MTALHDLAQQVDVLTARNQRLQVSHEATLRQLAVTQAAVLDLRQRLAACGPHGLDQVCEHLDRFFTVDDPDAPHIEAFVDYLRAATGRDVHLS